MSNLTILHLFPETLRLNGESGNVLALSNRATAADVKVKIHKVELGGMLPKKRPELIFLGAGTLQATILASKQLERWDSQIHQWISEGSKVLAVGSGFDLASQGLILADGSRLHGLSLTNTTHRITSNHLVGEVFLNKSFAGFINSDREIARSDAALSLGTVMQSDNQELIGYVDGYRDGKVWASNVQGPLLPMNPSFADEILAAAVAGYRPSAKLRSIDSLATKAREAISIRVGNRVGL